MAFELLYGNYIDTTSSIVVNSNTDASAYLFNPDTMFQYVSSGFNNDLTTSTLRINFSVTMTVSRIAILNHNLKEFDVFFNGATASNFALSGGDTTTSKWSTNSETSQFIRTTSQACTSVSFDMKKTITSNSDKAIGWLVIARERLEFARTPSARNYKPVLDTHDVVHRLSDGGTRIHIKDRKHSADVSFEHITEAFRDSLKEIYNNRSELIFVPIGTTTSWDEVIFPCVWEGPFEFYKFSDDAAGAGFGGKIRLLET